MAKFRLKRIAAQDLAGIVRYIAADNPAAARRFRTELYEKFATLADSPDMMPEQFDLQPGVRCLPFGNYLVFYRQEEDSVVVLRVLHGARHIAPDIIDP